MNVKRCFKCLGFNHNSEKCAEKEKICCGCAKVHEDNGLQCQEIQLKCINCIRANEKFDLKLDIEHSAFDFKCEVYQRKLEVIKKKIWQ